MIDSTSVAAAAPFGPAGHIAVERGLAEFRSGRPVVIDSSSGSIAALRYLGAMLYGVAPLDPLTLLGVALILVLVGVTAAFVPARRATLIDPLIALRGQ